MLLGHKTTNKSQRLDLSKHLCTLPSVKPGPFPSRLSWHRYPDCPDKAGVSAKQTEVFVSSLSESDWCFYLYFIYIYFYFIFYFIATLELLCNKISLNQPPPQIDRFILTPNDLPFNSIVVGIPDSLNRPPP